VWKEIREQWIIATALLVLGGGLLVAVAMFAEPPVPSAPATDVVRSLGLARLATLMLVVTAGMVCGGALFAAERESGTLTFLEVLPANLTKIWRAKIVAGAALTVLQLAVILLVAAILEVADRGFALRLLV
jgi:ABC-type transport system involved in cytochrome c biogenesis permease component